MKSTDAKTAGKKTAAKKTGRKKSKPRAITPHEDYGFFRPDSVARRVWGYPSTPLHGIVRATTIEELDPNLIAAVDATGDNYTRLDTRYRRTVQYFATVAFGDSRSVTKMADVLVKVHSKAIGVEPVHGGRYDANDPASQLWILVTGWHSVLAAYETFGPGRLTDAEAREYWADCAVAAELQTCDPADVPRSREEVREYFAGWRPHLSASEAAQNMMVHLLNGVNAIATEGPLLKVRRPANWLVRTGTIALLPQHMRRLAGIRQSRATDASVTVFLRAAYRMLARSHRMQRAILLQVAPSAYPIVAPHWNHVEPVDPVVATPADARRRYGYDSPARAHLDLRARQYERVFGKGQAPSDEGLLESQEVLGKIGADQLSTAR